MTTLEEAPPKLRRILRLGITCSSAMLAMVVVKLVLPSTPCEDGV
jgi:hypothetical protein